MPGDTGANAPTTVFIDLFDNGASAWFNIYNHTIREHCEYIHSMKIRFPSADVRGIRLWSYPPGDPTFMEWAHVRMTFRCGHPPSQHGLSSNKMALITSDCG